MEKLQDILVIIPARSGSKGLSDKNIKEFNGVPLVIKTLNQALRIFPEENIFISTDSSKYQSLIAQKANFQIKELRPSNLSNDYSNNNEYIHHALSLTKKKVKWVLILQCTSPLRTDEDIVAMINKRNKNIDLISSVFTTKSNPYYLHRIANAEGYLQPLLNNDFRRRQDCPKVYELNGAMFLLNIKSFRENNNSMFDLKKTIPFEMPIERSLDIDNELEFKIAEFVEKLNNHSI